jgi:hypothetical protein
MTEIYHNLLYHRFSSIEQLKGIINVFVDKYSEVYEIGELEKKQLTNEELYDVKVNILICLRDKTIKSTFEEVTKCVEELDDETYKNNGEIILIVICNKLLSFCGF